MLWKGKARNPHFHLESRLQKTKAAVTLKQTQSSKGLTLKEVTHQPDPYVGAGEKVWVQRHRVRKDQQRPRSPPGQPRQALKQWLTWPQRRSWGWSLQEKPDTNPFLTKISGIPCWFSICWGMEVTLTSAVQTQSLAWPLVVGEARQRAENPTSLWTRVSRVVPPASWAVGNTILVWGLYRLVRDPKCKLGMKVLEATVKGTKWRYRIWMKLPLKTEHARDNTGMAIASEI